MKNFGKNLGKRYADIKSNDKKGFSLIELVVVIAIMAILALIMVPNLTAYINKADVSKVQASLKNVHTAAEMVVQTNPDKKITGDDATDLANQIASYANLEEGKVITTGDAAEGKFLIEEVKEDGKDTGRIKVTTINKGKTHDFDGKVYGPEKE